MAEGLNRVHLIGNLVADSELKHIQSGESVLNFRVACTERYKSGEEWKESTEWVDCVLWGKRGEAIASHMKKGQAVFIEGSLATESWDKDGEKRYRTRVRVRNVILTGGKRDGDRPQQAQRRASQQQDQRGGGDDFA